jgi:molecular chaperone GrpE
MKEQKKEQTPENDQSNVPEEEIFDPNIKDINEGITEEPVEEKKPKDENELEELRNKYLRLVAEFDNYRKRTSRERMELIKTADKDVIVSLLDVLDDCDRASEQMENTDNINVVKEGVLLIFNKLKKILHSRGLQEMDSLHADFDAELHDAIAEVPAPSEELKGKVLDNIQKGYCLNDKIVRHAKVVVGK